MATHSSLTVGSIFDLLKFKLPDGSALQNVVEGLAERDDFSRLVPAYPANNGLTHHSLRTISLPTGYKVDVGGSWKASKVEREPFIEALCTLRSTYQAPKDTFTTEKPEVGKALLKAEKKGHVMALNQGITNLMITGDSAPDQSGIVGLMKRTPYQTYDSEFCFDAGDGATSTVLRSCWLIKPGVDTFHMLYNPNHPTLGIEQEDKGEQLITGLGTSNDEHRWDIMIEFMLQKGMCLRDQRAVKRIANVGCAPTEQPGNDLVNTIIEASVINAPTGGIMQVNDNGQVSELASNWLLMCDERLYAKLVIAANDKLMVYQSDANIYRTKLPMIGTDIVICRCDALNYTSSTGETAVVAAA